MKASIASGSDLLRAGLGPKDRSAHKGTAAAAPSAGFDDVLTSVARSKHNTTPRSESPTSPPAAHKPDAHRAVASIAKLSPGPHVDEGSGRAKGERKEEPGEASKAPTEPPEIVALPNAPADLRVVLSQVLQESSVHPAHDVGPQGSVYEPAVLVRHTPHGEGLRLAPFVPERSVVRPNKPNEPAPPDAPSRHHVPSRDTASAFVAQRSGDAPQPAGEAGKVTEAGTGRISPEQPVARATPPADEGPTAREPNTFRAMPAPVTAGSMIEPRSRVGAPLAIGDPLALAKEARALPGERPHTDASAVQTRAMRAVPSGLTERPDASAGTVAEQPVTASPRDHVEAQPRVRLTTHEQGGVEAPPTLGSATAVLPTADKAQTLGELPHDLGARVAAGGGSHVALALPAAPNSSDTLSGAAAVVLKSPTVEGAAPAPRSLGLEADARRGDLVAIDIRQVGEGIVGDRSSSGGAMAVSVVRQETHFRPAALAIQAPVDAAQSAGVASELPALRAEQGDAPRTQSTFKDDAVPSTPATKPSSGADRAESLVRAPSVAPVGQQVAAAITQDIAVAPPAASAPVAASTSPAAADPKAPLRLLKVALEPPELGRVTIRLRLTGQSLELKVTADKPETVRMLEKDRPFLARVLAESGYRAEDISVQASSPAFASSASARAPEPQTANQTAPTFQPNVSAEGERQQQPRQSHGESAQRPPAQETRNDEADSDTRRGGALYV
jgi:chemotaxis protein MotD